jgi:hypothetical protein
MTGRWPGYLPERWQDLARRLGIVVASGFPLPTRASSKGRTPGQVIRPPPFSLAQSKRLVTRSGLVVPQHRPTPRFLEHGSGQTCFPHRTREEGPVAAMNRSRLPAAVAAAQLASGVAGMVVALRRHHPYDVFWMHGQPDRSYATRFSRAPPCRPRCRISLPTQPDRRRGQAAEPARRTSTWRAWSTPGRRLSRRAVGSPATAPVGLGGAGVTSAGGNWTGHGRPRPEGIRGGGDQIGSPCYGRP